MKSGIYKITSPTGRVYVGQAVDIEKRWQRYNNLNCNGQNRLYTSLLKYGVKAHIFEVIEHCSIEKLNERERFWQDEFDVIGDKGLNCRLTRSKDKSGYLSDKTKEKIAKSKTGTEHSDTTITLFKNTRVGENNPMFGKTHTDRVKKEQSRRMKNKMIGSLNPNSKLVLDLQTGIFYESLKEACKALNLNCKVTANKLRGFRKNNTSLTYC